MTGYLKSVSYSPVLVKSLPYKEHIVISAISVYEHVHTCIQKVGFIDSR